MAEVPTATPFPNRIVFRAVDFYFCEYLTTGPIHASLMFEENYQVII